MSRLGLSNVYLKVGLGLIALGFASGIWLWATTSWAEPTGVAVAWVARASFASGVIIYFIGRVTQLFQKRERS
ncbi:hypothetical protein ACW7G2_10730 [Luteimonas sp. A277]